MLEACLNNKIIRDFLINYNQSRWQKLIPSLIEIAILNLNSSFHTVIFSEEDIKNIIDELKLNQNSNNYNTQSKKPKKETPSHVIFSKPSNQWRTADGGVPPISGNKEKEFYFNNSSITNNSKYSKDSKDIARENMKNKKIIKNTKSKIKEQVENDKRNYYNNKMNGMYQNNSNKPIEKINYAISYDKNLEPELIEKTTINKNKKGEKKIVEKMTQEEYEQKFPDEEKNIENEYEEEEDDDNNNEQNYEENEEEEYYQAPNQNYNNNINNIQYKNNNQNNNNQNRDRKNLYHYKNDNINKKNNILQNNMNQGNKTYNNNNPEFIQNPQQSFNPKFMNNIKQNKNQGKNNYINIENNSNEPQNINNNDYNYNPNPSEQYNNNYKIGMSESDDKSSKFIGIEQKYQQKIDELEKNIINAGDDYGDKLKVNITNMEDYAKNNNNNEYQNDQYNMNNNEDEVNENEENNLSDMDINDGGVLSQMSNMSERTKSLFKRAMDEYPPLEEDTFYEQSQNK